MPTENRSSNTEMVSVPEGYMLVERSIWTEQQVEAATACITRLKDVPTMTDRALAMAAIDAAQCTAPDIALSDLLPVPQPHPEPIAWMVGTAFWWTKEEAERDAAATGLPMIPFGPLMGAARQPDQHQGEPVALPARLPQRMPQGRNLPRNYAEAWNACLTEVEKLGPLYPRAVPDECDRLTKATAFVQRLVDCAGTQPSVATGYLRDILDELKGNTTPTAPVAHNENAAFESWARSRLTPLNLRLDEIGLYHDLVAGTAHDAWQARAALEIKAS